MWLCVLVILLLHCAYHVVACMFVVCGVGAVCARHFERDVPTSLVATVCVSSPLWFASSA